MKLSDGFTDMVMRRIAYREKVCRTRRRILVAACSVFGAACMVVGIIVYMHHYGVTSSLPGSENTLVLSEWMQDICNFVTVSIPAWLHTIFSAATSLGQEWIQEISSIVHYLGNVVSCFFSSVGFVFAGVDKNIFTYLAIVLMLAAIGYMLDRHKSLRHNSSVL